MFELQFTHELADPTFNTGTEANDRRFLRNLIGYYVIMEGLFFYVGFVQMLSFGRQNKMTGSSEEFQYILRDESMHLNFGIDLINQIKVENPHLWTPEFQAHIIALIKQAVELEYRYAVDTMPRGVLGLNVNMFSEYLQFIANRRLNQIGLPDQYPGAKNPFPWMSEMLDLKKEKNFFETRVIDYQTGGSLAW
jgi:ribonucleoside-diphosphate reductase beta chain